MSTKNILLFIILLPAALVAQSSLQDSLRVLQGLVGQVQIEKEVYEQQLKWGEKQPYRMEVAITSTDSKGWEERTRFAVNMAFLDPNLVNYEDGKDQIRVNFRTKPHPMIETYEDDELDGYEKEAYILALNVDNARALKRLLRNTIPLAQEAWQADVDILASKEEAAVAVFTSGDNFYTPPFEVLLPYGNDKGNLKEVIESMRSKEGGGTPLYNSISGLLDYVVQNSKNNNKAIIVFTDGDDTEGGSIPQLVLDAQTSGIEVYVVGLGGGVNQNELTLLALGTGGAVMFAEEVNQLISLYRSLSDLLRGEGEFYATCWTATNPFGNWNSGSTFSFTVLLELPTGETIRFPVTGVVP